MEIKEVIEQIDEATKGLKEQSQGALRTANNALEEAKKAIESMASKADATEVDKLKNQIEDLEKELTKSIDAAIVKMETKSVKEEKNESFESVLAKSIEENHDNIQKFARKEVKKIDLEIDLKAVGTFGTGNVTGSTVWGAIQKPGLITNPNTRTHIRSLLNECEYEC